MYVWCIWYAMAVTEEQCLHQLYIDEQFGGMEAKLKEKEKEEEKKK